MQRLKPPSTKQSKNEEALTKYAAFLCGLMLFVTVARWLRSIFIKSPHLKTSAASPSYGREAFLLVFQYVESTGHSVSTMLMLFTGNCRGVHRRHGLDVLLLGSSH